MIILGYDEADLVSELLWIFIHDDSWVGEVLCTLGKAWNFDISKG
jgi:hypothetical protein